MAFQFPLADKVLDPGMTMHHQMVEPTSCNWLKVEATLHVVENQTVCIDVLRIMCLSVRLSVCLSVCV